MGSLIRDVFAGLAEVASLAAQVDRKATNVLTVGDRARGRQTSLQGDCGACSRPVAGVETDRLRSGYCSACYSWWCRAGRPDRPGFEAATPAFEFASGGIVTETELCLVGERSGCIPVPASVATDGYGDVSRVGVL